jgi:hypothetical protein
MQSARARPWLSCNRKSQVSVVIQNLARSVLQEHGDFSDVKHLVDVRGMSGPKVCNFLNRLVAGMPRDECYLEVGTWRGLTLCSAALGNSGKVCVANDKFHLWLKGRGVGFRAKKALMRNMHRYKESSAEIQMHMMANWRFYRKPRAPLPVGVFFYDGEHSYENTRWGISRAAPWLADRCVLVVDDWENSETQIATEHGIRDAEYRALWSRVLGEHTGPDDWWNGLGVFYLERCGCADEPRVSTVVEDEFQLPPELGGEPSPLRAFTHEPKEFEFNSDEEDPLTDATLGVWFRPPSEREPGDDAAKDEPVSSV